MSAREIVLNANGLRVWVLFYPTKALFHNDARVLIGSSSERGAGGERRQSVLGAEGVEGGGGGGDK